jgi:hypothetical protein
MESEIAELVDSIKRSIAIAGSRPDDAAKVKDITIQTRAIMSDIHLMLVRAEETNETLMSLAQYISQTISELHKESS